ncbi:MAG: hypothetical protein U1E65_33015 [Myxococcota bacterium]
MSADRAALAPPHALLGVVSALRERGVRPSLIDARAEARAVDALGPLPMRAALVGGEDAAAQGRAVRRLKELGLGVVALAEAAHAEALLSSGADVVALSEAAAAEATWLLLERGGAFGMHGLLERPLALEGLVYLDAAHTLVRVLPGQATEASLAAYDLVNVRRYGDLAMQETGVRSFRPKLLRLGSPDLAWQRLLSWVVEARIQHFHFADILLGKQAAAVHALADLFAARGLPATWSIGIHAAEALDFELERLARGGLRQVRLSGDVGLFALVRTSSRLRAEGIEVRAPTAARRVAVSVLRGL